MSQGEQLPDNLVSYTEFHIHLCAVHTYYSIQDLMKLFECGIHVQNKDDLMHKLEDYDNTLKQNIELETRLKTLELERNRLNVEISKVKMKLNDFK